MAEEREYIVCTSKDGSVCVGCELNGKLNCKYDDGLVRCFRKRHLPFTVFGYIVLGTAWLLTGLWWTFLLYALVQLMNFTFIETLFLCRHCPFYEKEGQTLTCITLKGLPRQWTFDLSPMSRFDRIGMTIVGGLMDLFPLLVGLYASWFLLSTGADILFTILMIGLTVIFLIAIGYLEKYIGENYCEKCVNFSCMMNKVPDELKEKFLSINPAMREAWEASGYKSPKESVTQG